MEQVIEAERCVFAVLGVEFRVVRRFGHKFFQRPFTSMFPLFVLFFAAAIFAQDLRRPQAPSDTSVTDTLLTYEILDIVGEELKGTRHNAGEKKMIGTFVIKISNITRNRWPEPFILRLTFYNGGAFRMDREHGYSKGMISLRDLELRYRDRNDVSITKKFSRTLSRGRGGYVYEMEFLQEDLQPIYKMELWGHVNEREAKSAVGGIYKETIQIEIETKPGVTQEVKPEKAKETEGLNKRSKSRR